MEGSSIERREKGLALAVLFGLTLFCISVYLINSEPDKIEVPLSLEMKNFTEERGISLKESPEINIGDDSCLLGSKQIVDEAKNRSLDIEYTFVKDQETVRKRYALFAPGVAYVFNETYSCPSNNFLSDFMNHYRAVPNEEIIVYEKVQWKSWSLAFLFLIVPILIGIILYR